MTIISRAQYIDEDNTFPGENDLLWRKLMNHSFRTWGTLEKDPSFILERFELYGIYSCHYTLLQHRFLLWSASLDPSFKDRVDAIVGKIFNPKYINLIRSAKDDTATSTFDGLSEDDQIALIHIAAALGKTDFIVANHETITPLLGRKNFFGGSAFLAAACGEHYETMDKLLELYPDYIKEKNRNGLHPVHSAVLRSNTKMLEFFLERDPTLSSTQFTVEGWCAIHLAVHHGNLEVIDWMIRRNKDEIFVKTKDGKNIIHLAVMWGQEKVIDYLLDEAPQLIGEEDAFGRQMIHYAADADNQTLVARLLAIDPQISHRKDHLQFNPLHIAALNNRTKVFKYLLERDPLLLLAPTAKGEICTHLAAARGHTPIFNIIMESPNESVISVPSGEGWLPIHLAAKCGAMSLFEALACKDPASVHSITSSGMTPLFVALESNRQPIIKYLLEKHPQTVGDTILGQITVFEFALIKSPPVIIQKIFRGYILYLWDNHGQLQFSKEISEEVFNLIVDLAKNFLITLSDQLISPPFTFSKVNLAFAYLNFYLSLKQTLYERLDERIRIFGFKSKIHSTSYTNLTALPIHNLLSPLMSCIDVIIAPDENQAASVTDVKQIEQLLEGIKLIMKGSSLQPKSKTLRESIDRAKMYLEDKLKTLETEETVGDLIPDSAPSLQASVNDLPAD